MKAHIFYYLDYQEHRQISDHTLRCVCAKRNARYLLFHIEQTRGPLLDHQRRGLRRGILLLGDVRCVRPTTTEGLIQSLLKILHT